MKIILSWLRGNPSFCVLLAIAVFSAVVRVLLDSRLGTSAILYVAVPFSVTAFLLFVNPGEDAHWTAGYYRAFRATFGVLFGVSIVLYEGIVFVLMFLPIYLFFALLAMAAEAVSRALRHGSGRSARAYILPALVFLVSLEGTHDSLSFDRNESITVTRTANVPAEMLRENIAAPFELQKPRHWFLRVFPMPDRVVPESMQPGAIHEANFTYHRWLFTNTHYGRLLLEIADTSDLHVATRILEDTSYLSHYLQLQSTRIDLRPVDADTTEVSLSVYFERRLDPAWYFGPLQRYGVARMAELLIEEVVIR